MSADHNVSLVYRVVEEIWNGADLGVADALFAPAYVNHGGVISDLVRGPEAIKISVALYRTAFPDLHITVDKAVADRDQVVLHWTAWGIHTVGPDRIAPIRKPGRLSGATVSRLADGRIEESWTRWDRTDVLHQLGVIAPLREADPWP